MVVRIILACGILVGAHVVSANEHLTNKSNTDILLNGIGMKKKVEKMVSSGPSQIVSFFMSENSYQKLNDLFRDHYHKGIPSLYKGIGSVYENNFSKEELVKIIKFHQDHSLEVISQKGWLKAHEDQLSTEEKIKIKNYLKSSTAKKLRKLSPNLRSKINEVTEKWDEKISKKVTEQFVIWLKNEKPK